MDTPTFEELDAFQKHIKDLMDANTLTRVEDKKGKLEIVEESIDDHLQEELREARKRVFLAIKRRFEDKLPHKVRGV